MQQDDSPADEVTPTEAHWCVDCEQRLEAKDQGRSWGFCEYCVEAVCETCDRTHACEYLIRGKPKKWL